MRQYIFIINILFVSICWSQPSITWQKTIGGMETDRNAHFIQLSDGNYIIAGESDSDIGGHKSEDSQGRADFWIIKLSPAGDIIWDISIGGEDDELIFKILEMPDGSIVVAGESQSLLSGDLSEIGGRIWVVKVDSDGFIVWDNMVGPSSTDFGDMILTTDGGIAIGGSSSGGVSADKSEPQIGGYDYWLVKLNPDGFVQWDRTFGGLEDDDLRTIEELENGDFVIAGESESGIGGDKTEANAFLDFWVLRVNSVGEIIWQNNIGGDFFEYMDCSTLLSDGHVLVVGFSDSHESGKKTEPHFGGGDLWMVKLDSMDGSIHWQKTYGGDNYDEGKEIIGTADGNILVLAESNSDISGNKTEFLRGSCADFWLLELDENGDEIWQKSIGGDECDDPESMYLCSDGGILLSGASNSNTSFEKTDDPVGGLIDLWVVKLGTPLVVEEKSMISSSIEIFPNPNSGAFIIKNKSLVSANYQLTSVEGKIIQQNFQVNPGDNYYDFNLESGIYILHEIGKIGILSYKIIVK